jgi:hypothetical protein
VGLAPRRAARVWGGDWPRCVHPPDGAHCCTLEPSNRGRGYRWRSSHTLCPWIDNYWLPSDHFAKRASLRRYTRLPPFGYATFEDANHHCRGRLGLRGCLRRARCYRRRIFDRRRPSCSSKKHSGWSDCRRKPGANSAEPSAHQVVMKVFSLSQIKMRRQT